MIVQGLVKRGVFTTMNYNKKTVQDIDVAGKKVLLRCDFNVPMAKDGSGYRLFSHGQAQSHL